jgi:hypothetical protein
MKTEDYSEFVAQVEGYLNFQNDEKVIRSWDLENLLAMCTPGLSVKETRLLVRKFVWLLTYLVVVKNRKVRFQYIGQIEHTKSKKCTSWFPVLKHKKTYSTDIKPFKKKYEGARQDKENKVKE